MPVRQKKKRSEHTSIRPGPQQSLLLTSERDKLYVSVCEPNTFSGNGARNCEDARGSRTVVVGTWSACASEGSTTVVVPADYNGVVRRIDGRVPAEEISR